MRHEGLDPEGKVELAGLLLQIGFKLEAITEYLMAAEMYIEKEEEEKAAKLYERVLELDSKNQAAQHGLFKLKPKSQNQIDDMIAKMGFNGKPGEEGSQTPADVSPQDATSQDTASQDTASQTATPTVQEKTSSQTTVTEETPPAKTEEKILQAEPSPTTTHPTRAHTHFSEAPEVHEEAETQDLSHLGIEEFLASLGPTLIKAPEDLDKRNELAEFFREEGLWKEAFFETRAAYLASPSLEKLKELISLLVNKGDIENLTTFLMTESFAERSKEIQVEVLEALAKAYEDAGRSPDAERIQERLEKLQGKKVTVKTKKDPPSTPPGKDKDDSSEEKKSGHLRFV